VLPTPQPSFSSVDIMASFKSDVGRGHTENGLDRTGFPPCIASLDMI